MDKSAEVTKEIESLRDWLNRLERDSKAVAADGGVVPAILLTSISKSCTRLIYMAGMVNGAALSKNGSCGADQQPRSRSKKQKIEEELRESDLTAQLAERTDISYGHHDSLPRGEHVALRKVGLKNA